MSDCNDFKKYILEKNKNENFMFYIRKVAILLTTHLHYFTDFQNADIQHEKLMYTALDVKILSESKRTLLIVCMIGVLVLFIGLVGFLMFLVA